MREIKLIVEKVEAADLLVLCIGILAAYLGRWLDVHAITFGGGMLAGAFLFRVFCA